MTPSCMVEETLVVMEKHLKPALAELAVEDRLRLDGLEHFVRDVMATTMEGLWRLIGAHLDAEAELLAGLCGCGLRAPVESASGGRLPWR